MVCAISDLIFEGVCETHVILTPGAWKGGPEPQLMTPDPVDSVDPVDPVDPGMSSKKLKVDGGHST